ncbi:MAG: helix-turn-helix transcriptional regulator [Roseococcus sp.]
MVATADGLALANDGLHPATPALRQAMQAAVAGALHGVPGSLALARPSGKLAWQVELMPVAPGGVGLLRASGGAVVMVIDPAARRPASDQLLAAAFGLTPAEASLTASLLSGLSLADHARKRRVTMPTVRTHLARVLAKTGSRRQADLVARLAGMLASPAPGRT